jgi:acetoin:2,6-dichlorophenolindophenol oxidoreductase subunit alpha
MTEPATVDPAGARGEAVRPSLSELYRTMLRIRRFEERIQALSKRGKLPGFLHLYVGEEAVATGACAALGPGDWLTSTHRGHGHAIARGASLRRMMAELFGRIDGYSRAKGGSMHIADMDLGMLGANGIVGAGLPIATGAALAERLRGSDGVVLCFFGDGAANIGVFHESLNLAAVWRLPVVFLCENNGYTELTPTQELTAGGAIARRGDAYGIPNAPVDGNEVEAVFEAVERAVALARGGGGPSLIEARTYRFEDHNEGLERITGTRRPVDEIERWKAQDPLARAAERLASEAGVNAAELQAMEGEIAAEIDDAIAFAEASEVPDPSDAYRDGLIWDRDAP